MPISFALSDRIKRARVVVKRFLSQLRRNILPYIDRVDKLIFSGGITVRIVRADQQMILAGVLSDIRNILVRFASDVEPVLAEKISARAMLPFFFQQPPQDVYQKRRPTGRRFDETEAESGKLFRYFVRHDVAKSQQRHDSRMPEGVIACDVEHFEYRFHAAAGVHADRQILFLRFFVDWKQIGMVQGVLILDTAKENSDSTILFSEANLIDGFFDRMQGQYYRPLDLVRCRGPRRREKSVVGAAERELQAGIFGVVDQEQRRIDDLHGRI